MTKWRGSLALQVAADVAETGASRAISLVWDGGARVTYGREAKTDRARFLATVIRGDSDDECWVLPKGRVFYVSSLGKPISSRRFAWFLAKGKHATARLVTTCSTKTCCNPKHAKPMLAERERFLSFVPKHKPNECALWQGSRMVRARDGKGKDRSDAMRFSCTSPKKMVYASRYAYELVHGPIAPGGKLYKTCFKQACCNVRHMWIGTQKDLGPYLRAMGVFAKDSERKRGKGPVVERAMKLEVVILEALGEMKKIRVKSYYALLQKLRDSYRRHAITGG